jgi:hypothetical protein
MSTTAGDDYAGQRDEPSDSGDQAQDLRSRLEQEAIEAALAGHPRGDDVMDRDARVENLESEDPMESAMEGDSSDDPLHGGDDITGIEPEPRAMSLEPDGSTVAGDDEDDEA